MTIPDSVTVVGDYAFADSGLTSVYFEGNAPTADSTVFAGTTNVTAYYLQGTMGWGAFSARTGIGTVLLTPDSLQVTISPAAAISAGAQWRVDGRAWQNSAATVTNLSPGNHTVTFSTISGWTTPANETVSVSGNSTISVTGTYVAISTVVTFTANPTSGAVPLTVSFTPAGVDSGGNAITNWYWTFGDGSTSTARNPSHTYTTTGTFSPALVATNNIGDAVIGSGTALITATAVQSQFTYTTSNATITITGYTGSGGAAAIPSTINGLPVSGIGYEAFIDRTNLISVTIPNGVGSIGESAFAGCASLASVAIPGTVTNIGGNAFWACYSLTNATVPASVTNIGIGAFDYCTSLAHVTVPGSFRGRGFEALFLGCTNLTNATIANGVTTIGTNAFQYTATLTSITIPDSVTNIGDEAFSYCPSLTSVTIPESVTGIGQAAFVGCSSLASVTIPGSVTSIGIAAFLGCSSLTSVYFQGNAPSPSNDLSVFSRDTNATVYYMAGTAGWSSMFDGRPAVLWNPQVRTSDASFGVRTNQFGFTISGTSDLVVVVEASTNLANAAWYPLQTNTLTGGSFYFSDPQWTNYPGRFYRLRSP